jgi:hypothetical protein
MQHTSACDDCVVTVVLGRGATPLELDEDERDALDNLAEAGLVAPLRLVPREERRGEPRAVGDGA